MRRKKGNWWRGKKEERKLNRGMLSSASSGCYEAGWGKQNRGGGGGA